MTEFSVIKKVNRRFVARVRSRLRSNKRRMVGSEKTKQEGIANCNLFVSIAFVRSDDAYTT